VDETKNEIEVELEPFSAEYFRARALSDYVALTRFHADKGIVNTLNQIVLDFIKEDGGL
jgi:hypothetical protein